MISGIEKLSNPCSLCAHRCGVNRPKGEKGACNAGEKPAVYSYSPHHGEEPPISGTRGSGTIFFTRCNLKCIYCQNHTFSQETDVGEGTVEELAARMIELENLGCHNINLVSPTHYAPQIVQALELAASGHLDIPIVYNTGGYDTPELIKLLDGSIDIYMPDIRYRDSDMANKYSGAPGYAENSKSIIKEMYGQVGPLKVNGEGIAQKGMLVRLLVLPNNISGTIETLKFLKEDISTDIYLSVMSQYHPTYKAKDHPELSRRITPNEYKAVVDEVERLGFENGWIQGYHTDPERFLGTNIPR
ncbi:MAG: radical SAM protein [Candidatus Omnitrophica bacterium]|nr:radical SAM protein [Candidatus Omnitrophota bacterium]